MLNPRIKPIIVLTNVPTPPQQGSAPYTVGVGRGNVLCFVEGQTVGTAASQQEKLSG